MISGGFFIKRLAFFGILNILIFSILTCNIFEPYENEPDYPNNNDRSDYVYSQDGKYLTIYLDGNAPPPQSRAINRDIAISGHDYFEIAFLHPEGGPNPDPANDVIARASWELREGAGVTGVYRTFAGVDYRYVSRADAVANNDGVADAGAAILFVGKKTDKTLLAVGRLIGVDNGNGLIQDLNIVNPDPNSRLITTATQSVTFLVDSLKAGVVYPTESSPGVWQSPSNSSFLTAAKGSNHQDVSAANTDVRLYTIGGHVFPMFKLTQSIAEMCAEYTFRISSDVGALKAGFDEYARGIILARQGHGEEGNFYSKKQPRYPISGQGFQGYSLRLDDRTEIEPKNNYPTVGVPFENPARLCFNTTFTENGSVFALVFAIPICPLSIDGNPGMWYLRPSYDSYLLDIDDGRGGTGGAILISTGEMETPTGYRIRVEIPPYKFLYGNNTPVSGRDFDIRGLVVRMEYPDGTLIRYIDHSELAFYIGGAEKIPGSPSDNSVPYPSGAGYTSYSDPNRPNIGVLNNQLYGIQTVLVNFRDPVNGTTHTDAFPIICNDSTDTPNWASIPENHIYVVTPRSVADNNTGAWILNLIQQGSGTYVIIAPASFNFQDINMPANPNSSYLFIIVAGTLDEESTYSNAAVIPTNDIRGEPGEIIRIGKGSNNPNDAINGNGTGNAFTAWRTTSSFYFGKWPFNSRLEVTPNAWPNLGTHGANYIPLRGWYKTYPYIINAGGPIARLYNYAGANPFDTVTADVPPYAPQTGNTPNPPGGNNYFLEDGFGGHIYSVIVDEDDVKIMNLPWFK